VIPRPTFHDKQLRAAFDECAPVIEGFTAALDRMSGEIKHATAWLRNCGVDAPFRLQMAGLVPNSSSLHELAWMEHEGKWEICLVGISDGVRLAKPLIRCRLDARIAGWKELPRLLKQIAVETMKGSAEIEKHLQACAQELPT